jgi:hypothetical protein
MVRRYWAGRDQGCAGEAGGGAEGEARDEVVAGDAGDDVVAKRGRKSLATTRRGGGGVRGGQNQKQSGKG